MKWLKKLFGGKSNEIKPIKDRNQLGYHLDKVLNYQGDKDEESLSHAEKMLKAIEKELKFIILKKQEIIETYEKTLRDLKRNEIEGTKMENRVLLLYDYYLREVKILKLQEQLKTMPINLGREKISRELNRLICINAGLERGTKKRDIDPEIIIGLRKQLRIHERN